jgi:hypothetical protein
VPKVTTEEIVAAAKAAEVEISVTQKPRGTAEITPLPGVRRPTERHDGS